MEHVEPEVLALAALGEPVDDLTRAHLDTCPECAAEADALVAVVATARSVTVDDAPVAPPAAVWDRVRDELGLTPALAPDRDLPAGTAEVVVPMRRRRAPWVLAAAAAGLVVGGAGGVAVSTGFGGQEDPPPVIAEATLDPLPGWEATGVATVHEAADGSRELVLSIEGNGDDDGFREVWLIDRDVTRLVSLGVLEGTEGRFTVPSGLDLDDFAVVDVSAEPYDGDPAHSGDSIIRGLFDA